MLDVVVSDPVRYSVLQDPRSQYLRANHEDIQHTCVFCVWAVRARRACRVLHKEIATDFQARNRLDEIPQAAIRTRLSNRRLRLANSSSSYCQVVHRVYSGRICARNEVKSINHFDMIGKT